MRQQPDQSIYDQGGGYVGQEPLTEVSRELIPPPKTSRQQHDYVIPKDEVYTVFTGNLPATFVLLPATGSLRVHNIVRAGTGSLTVDAGDGQTISGDKTYSVAQGCSLSVFDYAEARWVGTASIVPVVVVISGHSVTDANYTVSGTTNQTVTYTSLAADRTVYLPPASSTGQTVVVQDGSGSCGWGKKIIVSRSGSDTIHGSSVTSVPIWMAYGSITLQSDGAGKWYIVGRTPKTWYTRWLSSTSYTPEPDAIMQQVLGQACGASGGNANTVYGGGGGGGAGNVGEWVGVLPVGTPVTITIGSAGAARAIGAALDGQDGGNVSFGSYLVCYGGKGGKKPVTSPGVGGFFGDPQAVTSLELLRSRFVTLSPTTMTFAALQRAGTPMLGDGGTGSDGGLNPATSGSGNIFSATYPGGAAGSDANVCAGGGGGSSSPFGAGGKGGERPVAGQPVVAGVAGSGYGSGGGGAGTTATADGASGAGAPGFIDIWVFF